MITFHFPLKILFKKKQKILTLMIIFMTQNGDLELDYTTVACLASLPLHCYSTQFPHKGGQVFFPWVRFKPRDSTQRFNFCGVSWEA